jgi:hypothetical protein
MENGKMKEKLKGMGRWKLLFTICFLSLSLFSKAQEKTGNPVMYFKMPLQVSIGNQVVGFPNQNEFSAINPSFSLGTEIGYNKSLTHRICQTFSTGYIVNDVIGNTVTLSSDFCYRFTLKKGVFADLSLGLGMLFQQHPRDVYAYVPAIEGYKKSEDNWKPASLIEYAISLGYDFSRNSKCPVSIFVRSNFFIQSPYFPTEMFPIMPQSITQLGLRFKFRKK